MFSDWCRPVLPQSVTTGIAIVVTLAWVANLIVGYFKIADTDPSVNAVFMIIVGALFAMSRKKKGPES